jgi:hypothetical protein
LLRRATTATPLPLWARNELPPSDHWINSSTVASSVSGM